MAADRQYPAGDPVTATVSVQRLLAAGALIAGLIAWSPAPPAAMAQSSCLADLGIGDPGTDLPVVLVHGFTGNPEIWDRAASVLENSGVDLRVYRFDYSSHATEWVDHPSIGPLLRRWIVCLGDTSQTNGGVGRVGIVAHSMGGLATRLAMSGNRDGAPVAERVALVATLGTPHRGALLAGPNADGSVEGTVGRFLWEQTAGRIADQLATPAGRALSRGSRELGQLPAWPDGVAVWGGAGEFIAEQRFLFFSSQTPLGDGIVDVPSATAAAPAVDRLGGTEVIDCRIPVPLDLGLAGAGAAISYAVSRDPGLLACAHTNLPRTQRLMDPVLAQLAAASGRPERAALEDADFQNVTLPAGSCRYGSWENPAPIPLNNGTGESSDGTFEGVASVLSVRVVGFADFDANGTIDALLDVECSGTPLDQCCAGTASIDHFGVVLTGGSEDLELMGGVPITATYSEQGLITTDSVSIDGTTIVMNQRFGYEGEPDCCRSGTETVRWVWRSGGWTVE